MDIKIAVEIKQNMFFKRNAYNVQPSQLIHIHRHNSFYSGTFANSEDPDEMPHNAAFHQGIHSLFR